MSRRGTIVAIQHGESLPKFASLAEARKQLSQVRKATLSEFLSDVGVKIRLDFSPESLKELERWYFENGCPASGETGYSMVHAIGFYFGEILCRVGHFKWCVDEFAFVPGRYGIGVQRGLGTIMLTKGLRPKEKEHGNKRMQSLFRSFKSAIRT